MKRKILILITVLMIIPLVASCGGGKSADTVTTAPATEAAAETVPAEETVPAATEPAETEAKPAEPVTEKITLPEDGGQYSHRTPKVTAATFKSVRQRTDSDVKDVIIYCETEPGATVYVCDKGKNVLRCEKAYGPCFYTALPLEGDKQYVGIYAKSEGKAISGVVKLTLKETESVGANVYCGKDSRIFLNWYDAHYYGDVIPTEEDLDIAEMMLRSNLEKARVLTGKNTKIIALIATNPAVIYHDRQYDEPFGRGDCLAETSSTMLAKRLKDDPDIYFIDLREVLLAHRDEEIFFQTDSHWTQLGGYYGYLEMMNYVHKDFPDAPVADIFKYNIVHDYRISDLMTDNFLNGYGIGMREYAIYIAQTPVSKVATEESPSIYYVGDSYTGCIYLYFYDTFSNVTTNDLYDYNFKNLETLKPDYLVYVFTERNLDSQASIVWAQTEIE